MTNFSSNNRRALTLIEMLIGMAITLVMMAAVVNLFANISQGVRNRRATMEISANLRIARTQLFNDLAGATCLKYPKNTHGVMPKPDSNNPPDGYFEYVEGEYSDDNPYALGSFDQATSLLPSSNLPFNSKGEPLDPNIVTDGGGLGDYDDILAMTVENEVDQFRGKGRGLRPGGDPDEIVPGTYGPTGDWVDKAITSPVAEVVWFAVQNRNIPGRPDGEPGLRKIYRRTLLVVPWYGTETNSAGTGSDPLLDLAGQGITSYEDQIRALRQFQVRYDISARLENGRIVPNTLADLARRENRFGHLPNDHTTAATPVYYFPHLFPYNSNAFSVLPANSAIAGGIYSSLQPLDGGEPFDDIVYPTAIHDDLFAETERDGEDLVLSNVLAFDIQIYDPGAPLYNYQGSIINPSSSQAFLAATASISPTAVPPANSLTGFGAYVDLGWNNGTGSIPDYKYGPIQTAIPTAPAPLFQQERRLGWHPLSETPLMYNMVSTPFRGTPAVYDTWTTYYENDQINQDELLYGMNTAVWQRDVIDQGTNGLDEDGANGPDDPLERETSPPYPSPLLGVQVKLRVYEPESRQIRETSVTRNLAK